MTLTFTTPEWGEKTCKAWKEHATPCYLKKTPDPLSYSVCMRPGIDPVFGSLFVIEMCMHPNCHKQIRKEILRSYSEEEKNKILKEFKDRFDCSFKIS